MDTSHHKGLLCSLCRVGTDLHCTNGGIVQVISGGLSVWILMTAVPRAQSSMLSVQTFLIVRGFDGLDLDDSCSKSTIFNAQCAKLSFLNTR